MVTLARYRLRPLPCLRLAVVVCLGALSAAALYADARDAASAYGRLATFAAVLGLGGALLTAPETDPDSDALEPVPRAAWRTTAARLTAWAVLGGTAQVGLAVVLSGSRGWSAPQLLLGAGPAFGLLTAVSAAVAARSSALMGGAAGLAILLVLEVLPTWYPRVPLQLGLVPGHPLAAAASGWTLGVTVALFAVVVGERRRRGLGPPGIRRGRARRLRAVAPPAVPR